MSSRTRRGPWKPTPAQIAAARNRTIRDVIAPGLRILFCGINPSLYSAAIGHHFGRPGNRFWPTLHAAGFTDRLLSPFEDRLLLERGYGITNLVARATAAADELTESELRAGATTLRRKARRYEPQCIAFLGITSYRIAFDLKNAALGRQTEKWGESILWILPNPSGLNAHYKSADLAEILRDFRRAIRR
jgi:TDG/mug DNA glycosylase family protein